MPLSLTYTIENKATWSYVDNQNGVIHSQIGSFSANSGISLPTSGRLYQNRITIPSGGSPYQLDLFNLTKVQFSGATMVNFSGGALRGLYFRNANSGVTEEIFLSTTGQGRFIQMIGTPVSGMVIKPLTASHFDNLQGWTIGTGRYIDVKTIPNTGATFEVALVGTV